MRKRLGDEAFRVSFKFPRRRWDQRLVDFNRLSRVERKKDSHLWRYNNWHHSVGIFFHPGKITKNYYTPVTFLMYYHIATKACAIWLSTRTSIFAVSVQTWNTLSWFQIAKIKWYCLHNAYPCVESATPNLFDLSVWCLQN